MQHVAFVSPLGGVGRTTLTAHCATLLAGYGAPVLALELSGQNTLGLHLGLSKPPETGWQDAVRAGRWWAEGALETAAGLHLLLHGAWAPQAVLPPNWLAGQLAELDWPDTGIAVLDTPALPAPLAQQALAWADLALLVLDAAPRAVRAHAEMLAWMQKRAPAQRWAVVVTGVDPRSSTRRNALAALRRQWGERLLPYVLHQDEHVPQAQEQALCVHQTAPQAQAAHDLQGIAGWIAQTLGHTAPARKGSDAA